MHARPQGVAPQEDTNQRIVSIKPKARSPKGTSVRGATRLTRLAPKGARATVVTGGAAAANKKSFPPRTKHKLNFKQRQKVPGCGSGFGFRVSCFELALRIWDFGFGIWDLGFRVWGLRFGVSVLHDTGPFKSPTLHLTPCTLHPTPYTLHPPPSTLHPTP